MFNLYLTARYKVLFKHLSRYAFVGLLTNGAGYLVYLLITYFGAAPKSTMTLLYAVGTAIGYIGNRNFTFAHKGSLLGSSVRYFIAYLFGYLVNLIILVIFVDYFMYPHEWVQGVAIFVVAGFLFAALSLFVFTNLDISDVDKI